MKKALLISTAAATLLTAVAITGMVPPGSLTLAQRRATAVAIIVAVFGVAPTALVAAARMD